MCIMLQASCMAARHHWLEMTSCFSGLHVLVNMADFGDDLEIVEDVSAAKQSHEDDDASGGGSDGTSSALTERDADVVPEKRRRRRAYHKNSTTEKEESTCAHSAESGVAVRVEAATSGYTWIWCLKS